MDFLKKEQLKRARHKKELYETAIAYYKLRNRLHDLVLDLKDTKAKEAILKTLDIVRRETINRLGEGEK